MAVLFEFFAFICRDEARGIARQLTWPNRRGSVGVEQAATQMEGAEVSLPVAAEADDAKDADSVRFEQAEGAGEEKTDIV